MALKKLAPTCQCNVGIKVGKIGATLVSKAEILSELMVEKINYQAKSGDIEVLVGILNEHRKKNDTLFSPMAVSIYFTLAYRVHQICAKAGRHTLDRIEYRPFKSSESTVPSLRL